MTKTRKIVRNALKIYDKRPKKKLVLKFWYEDSHLNFKQHRHILIKSNPNIRYETVGGINMMVLFYYSILICLMSIVSIHWFVLPKAKIQGPRIFHDNESYTWGTFSSAGTWHNLIQILYNSGWGWWSILKSYYLDLRSL